MSRLYPAIKGQFGRHEYFLFTMKAQDMTSRVRLPQELPEWPSLQVEERFQRILNLGRVSREIAPYLANNQDRFFGAVILAAMNYEDNIDFESLSELSVKLPALYGTHSENIGYLVCKGGEVLIPLDGQHRVKALDLAIAGHDDKGRALVGAQASPQVGNDDVSVVLVPFKTETARAIFTRVNRYARATSKTARLVTDDEDLFAWFARKVANECIGAQLCNIANTTLSQSDANFTTLSALYNTVQMIVETSFPSGKVSAGYTVSEDRRQLYWDKIVRVWQTVIEEIPAFRDALADRSPTGDKVRIEIRKRSLLGKPVGQEVLIGAFLRLTGAPTNKADKAAAKALAKLPWTLDETGAVFWQRSLWSGSQEGGKIQATVAKRRLAVRIAAHAAGEKLSTKATEELFEQFAKEFPESEKPTGLPQAPKRKTGGRTRPAKNGDPEKAGRALCAQGRPLVRLPALLSLNRRKTALSRSDYSRPIKLALADGVIGSKATVFDYGCGRGDDVRYLGLHGVQSWGWDPAHKPDGPLDHADVVNLGYVVNVIEDEHERVSCLKRAWSFAERALVVSARLSSEKPEFASVESYGDGFVTSIPTFQKFYDQAELKDWIEAHIPEPTVAAGPGVFYVFRESADRIGFLAQRYARRRRFVLPSVQASIDEHREFLAPLIEFFERRGRAPADDELEQAELIKERFGSLRRALELIQRAHDQEEWRKIIRPAGRTC